MLLLLLLKFLPQHQRHDFSPALSASDATTKGFVKASSPVSNLGRIFMTSLRSDVIECSPNAISIDYLSTSEWLNEIMQLSFWSVRFFYLLLITCILVINQQQFRFNENLRQQAHTLTLPSPTDVSAINEKKLCSQNVISRPIVACCLFFFTLMVNYLSIITLDFSLFCSYYSHL